MKDELNKVWLRTDYFPLFRPMMLDFIESRAEKMVTKPLPRSLEEWEKRKHSIRRSLLKSLGLLPLPERAKLRMEKTGIMERDDYRIEKLVFEAWPRIKVTGHLYIPKKSSLPAPGILYACGHWYENGKSEPDVQACCIGLTKLGFVVLVIDPVGQGERGPRRYDHCHPEMLLVGLSQAGFTVWEHVRALDLLTSLDIVDPNMLGMTGASGGGLYTLYTSAIDERIKVSIPVCYVTSFLHMLKVYRGANWGMGGAIDLCNQVPNIVSYADTHEIVGLHAPDPCMIVTASRDEYFTPQAAKDVYDKASMIYGLYGESDNLRFVEADSVHGYDAKMREAAYGFLMKWLMLEGDGSPVAEPILVTENPKSPEVRCLSKRVSQGSLTTQLTEILDKKNIYRRPKNSSELLDYQRYVRTKLTDILGNFPGKTDLNESTISTGEFEDFTVERVLYSSEPGIQVSSFLILPTKTRSGSFVIYLDDRGKDKSLMGALINTLAGGGAAILALDVRGTGDTKYAEEFEIATDSLMMGSSLLGQRVWDTLRGLDYLQKRFSPDHVKIIGNGWISGSLALLTASLDDRLERVFVNRTLFSFRSLIRERQVFPTSLFLFDILRHFDLPQIASSIAPRHLTFSNPVDGLGYPVSLERMEKEWRFAFFAYRLFEAESNFRMLASPSKVVRKTLRRWFRDRLDVTPLAAKVCANVVGRKLVSSKSIAKDLHLSEEHTERALNELVAKGVLKPCYSHRNKYTLAALPEVLERVSTSVENELVGTTTFPFKDLVE